MPASNELKSEQRGLTRVASGRLEAPFRQSEKTVFVPNGAKIRGVNGGIQPASAGSSLHPSLDGVVSAHPFSTACFSRTSNSFSRAPKNLFLVPFVSVPAFRRWSAAAVLILLGAACSRPDPDLDGRAQTLIAESQWDDAIDLLKRRLIQHPDDVAAHFYLGRCYLNGSMFYPGAAAGEFETALQLFTDKGRHSPIAEYEDQYFELRCHLELAKVYLRTYLELADRGAPKSVLQQPMRNLKKAAESAEKIAPDSQDVRDLKSVIQSL